MAPQHLTQKEDNNITARLKKLAGKTIGFFVAGLLISALFFGRYTGNASQPANTPAEKGASQQCTANDTNSKSTQCSNGPSFSIMPGGLSRFLQ